MTDEKVKEILYDLDKNRNNIGKCKEILSSVNIPIKSFPKDRIKESDKIELISHLGDNVKELFSVAWDLYCKKDKPVFFSFNNERIEINK